MVKFGVTKPQTPTKMSTRVQNNVKRAKYPSDISKNGWKRLRELLPKPRNQSEWGGRPTVDMREVINAIFYVVKTGCSWRCLPHDFPKWQTVYGYFNRWSQDGTWEMIHTHFIRKVRRAMGRKKRPTAAIIDSQSADTTSCGGGHRGYDAAKKVSGRKRFILTDSQGLLLAVWICAASVSESLGAQQLLRYIKRVPYLKTLCSRIQLVWADAGYDRTMLRQYVQRLWGWTWQIIRRSDDVKGFQLLPRRWVVERTFAWLLNARRLSKDYEKKRRNSQSMVYIAMLPIMLRRLG